MATKSNKYDCLAKAEPGEPMFHLLGRDPLAPHLVELWRLLRAREYDKAREQLERAVWAMKNVGKNTLPLGSDKSKDAAEIVLAMLACPQAMEAWSAVNQKTWFPR
jgi:hypothetical protein